MAHDRCSSVFIIQEMHGEHQLSNYVIMQHFMRLNIYQVDTHIMILPTTSNY